MVKLAKFGGVLKLTYTDTFSVYRYTDILNPDGTTGKAWSPVHDLQDVPCRVSFKTADSSGDRTIDSNPLRRDINVFCSVDKSVKKGDLIVANKYSDDGNVLQTYRGYSNLPSVYVTHQEITLQEEGDA